MAPPSPGDYPNRLVTTARIFDIFRRQQDQPIGTSQEWAIAAVAHHIENALYLRESPSEYHETATLPRRVAELQRLYHGSVSEPAPAAAHGGHSG